MRLLADAVAPLALGAAVAVALSACAVPRSTAASTAPAPKSTAPSPAGSRVGSAAVPVPVTIAKPTARAAARPAGERVPASAEAVTISMDVGANQGGKAAPKPVTITDQATVSALKALINGLAPFPPGAFNCAADFGDELTLTFRATPGAAALAVATVDLSGCQGVDLSINGKSQPALAGPGTDNGPRVLKTAGLTWQIPAA